MASQQELAYLDLRRRLSRIVTGWNTLEEMALKSMPEGVSLPGSQGGGLRGEGRESARVTAGAPASAQGQAQGWGPNPHSNGYGRTTAGEQHARGHPGATADPQMVEQGEKVVTKLKSIQDLATLALLQFKKKSGRGSNPDPALLQKMASTVWSLLFQEGTQIHHIQYKALMKLALAFCEALIPSETPITRMQEYNAQESAALRNILSNLKAQTPAISPPAMQTAAPIGRVQKVNNARPVSLWVGRGCGRPRLRVAYDRYACDIRIPLSGGLAYQLQAALPLLFDHACWAQLTGNLDGTSFMCFPMVMNDFDNVAKFGLLPGDMISSVAEGHSEKRCALYTNGPADAGLQSTQVKVALDFLQSSCLSDQELYAQVEFLRMIDVRNALNLCSTNSTPRNSLGDSGDCELIRYHVMSCALQEALLLGNQASTSTAYAIEARRREYLNHIHTSRQRVIEHLNDLHQLQPTMSHGQPAVHSVARHEVSAAAAGTGAGEAASQAGSPRCSAGLRRVSSQHLAMSQGQPAMQNVSHKVSAAGAGAAVTASHAVSSGPSSGFRDTTEPSPAFTSISHDERANEIIKEMVSMHASDGTETDEGVLREPDGVAAHNEHLIVQPHDAAVCTAISRAGEEIPGEAAPVGLSAAKSRSNDTSVGLGGEGGSGEADHGEVGNLVGEGGDAHPPSAGNVGVGTVADATGPGVEREARQEVPSKLSAIKGPEASRLVHVAEDFLQELQHQENADDRPQGCLPDALTLAGHVQEENMIETERGVSQESATMPNNNVPGDPNRLLRDEAKACATSSPGHGRICGEDAGRDPAELNENKVLASTELVAHSPVHEHMESSPVTEEGSRSASESTCASNAVESPRNQSSSDRAAEGSNVTDMPSFLPNTSSDAGTSNTADRATSASQAMVAGEKCKAGSCEPDGGLIVLPSKASCSEYGLHSDAIIGKDSSPSVGDRGVEGDLVRPWSQDSEVVICARPTAGLHELEPQSDDSGANADDEQVKGLSASSPASVSIKNTERKGFAHNDTSGVPQSCFLEPEKLSSEGGDKVAPAAETATSEAADQPPKNGITVESPQIEVGERSGGNAALEEKSEAPIEAGGVRRWFRRSDGTKITDVRNDVKERFAEGRIHGAAEKSRPKRSKMIEVSCTELASVVSKMHPASRRRLNADPLLVTQKATKKPKFRSFRMPPAAPQNYAPSQVSELAGIVKSVPQLYHESSDLPPFNGLEGEPGALSRECSAGSTDLNRQGSSVRRVSFADVTGLRSTSAEYELERRVGQEEAAATVRPFPKDVPCRYGRHCKRSRCPFMHSHRVESMDQVGQRDSHRASPPWPQERDQHVSCSGGHERASAAPHGGRASANKAAAEPPLAALERQGSSDHHKQREQLSGELRMRRRIVTDAHGDRSALHVVSNPKSLNIGAKEGHDDRPPGAVDRSGQVPRVHKSATSLGPSKESEKLKRGISNEAAELPRAVETSHAAPAPPSSSVAELPWAALEQQGSSDHRSQREQLNGEWRIKRRIVTDADGDSCEPQGASNPKSHRVGAKAGHGECPTAVADDRSDQIPGGQECASSLGPSKEREKQERRSANEAAELSRAVETPYLAPAPHVSTAANDEGIQGAPMNVAGRPTTREPTEIKSRGGPPRDPRLRSQPMDQLSPGVAGEGQPKNSTATPRGGHDGGSGLRDCAELQKIPEVVAPSVDPKDLKMRARAERKRRRQEERLKSMEWRAGDFVWARTVTCGSQAYPAIISSVTGRPDVYPVISVNFPGKDDSYDVVKGPREVQKRIHLFGEGMSDRLQELAGSPHRLETKAHPLSKAEEVEEERQLALAHALYLCALYNPEGLDIITNMYKRSPKVDPEKHLLREEDLEASAHRLGASWRADPVLILRLMMKWKGLLTMKDRPNDPIKRRMWKRERDLCNACIRNDLGLLAHRKQWQTTEGYLVG